MRRYQRGGHWNHPFLYRETNVHWRVQEVGVVTTRYRAALEAAASTEQPKQPPPEQAEMALVADDSGISSLHACDENEPTHAIAATLGMRTIAIKSGVLAVLSHFYGLSKECPYAFLEEFYRYCDIQPVPVGSTSEDYRLKAIPFVLKGDAGVWLSRLPEGSIRTWTEFRMGNNQEVKEGTTGCQKKDTRGCELDGAQHSVIKDDVLEGDTCWNMRRKDGAEYQRGGHWNHPFLYRETNAHWRVQEAGGVTTRYRAALEATAATEQPKQPSPEQAEMALVADDSGIGSLHAHDEKEPTHAIAATPGMRTIAIKSGVLAVLSHFYSLSKECPYTFLEEFYRYCDIQPVPAGSTFEDYRLKAIPFVLNGDAGVWLSRLPEGSIRTWAEFRMVFLDRFFPA
ncbi:hypothetical protein SASPL_154403 [Salvia splendens]|uniref:Uncharacterized protein n=1 Tax=Salvia splendens TaxID=180675 RepID=A0A8X8W005_SALSN|nr:hypothetical protein SASPL_154403 [Salvia splendens]